MFSTQHATRFMAGLTALAAGCFLPLAGAASKTKKPNGGGKKGGGKQPAAAVKPRATAPAPATR